MNEAEYGPNSPRATDGNKYRVSPVWNTVKRLKETETQGHVCLQYGKLGVEFAEMSSTVAYTHVCRAPGNCADQGRTVL